MRACSSAVPPPSLRTRLSRRPPTPPTVLFQGCSTFSGAGLQTAVGGDTPAPTHPGLINRYSIITDFSDLATLFQVSSSVSVDKFFVDSADMKASFLNSLNITQYSVVIAIHCRADATLSVTSQVDLLSSVAVPKTRGELQSFVSAYGDSWVNSITSTSEYVACYVFYATSLEEQQSVKAQMSGKIIGEDGSATAGFTADQQSKLQKISTRSVLYGELYGLDPSGLDPSNLLDVGKIAAMVTPTAAQTSGWITDYGTLYYENLDGPNSQGLHALIENTSLPTNRITYAQLAPWVDQLQSRLNQVDAVWAVYDSFGYAGDTQTGTNRTPGKWAQQMSIDRQAMIDQISELLQNPLVPPSNPAVYPPMSLGYGVPLLNFTLSAQTPPMWGGSGGPGDTAVYVDSSIILGGNVLKGLTIDGGAEVNYLQLQYTNLSDPLLLGRQEGGTAHSWTFQPEEGEQVNSVSVTAGGLINQLTVTTNKGINAVWPLEPRKANPQYPWSPSSGSAFAGFAVTFDGSGNDLCLKTLTPVAVTFQPANWTGVGSPSHT